MDAECKTTRALNTPHSHVPYGETGTGHYTKKVTFTPKYIDTITPAVLNCLASIPVEPGSVFSVADYGCADGGTSMTLMYACVKELRRLYGEELEICVQYEDQPVNDFKSLFSFLHGLIPGPRSYLAEFSNVYVSACGTGFYNQCFPSGSVNLGFSNIALNWLSRKPCNISDAAVHLLTKNPVEREMFRKQAESDWESFLYLRAKELSPGGRLALTVLSDWDEGHKKTSLSFEVHKVIYKVLQAMAEDGVISKDELHDTTFCLYFRSDEELMKPFESQESPVKKAGLSVVSLETKGFPVHYWTKDIDAKTAEKMRTDSIRCWSNYTLLSGLSDARSPEEKSTTTDEFYSRLETELVPKAAELDRLELVTSFIIFEKAV